MRPLASEEFAQASPVHDAWLSTPRPAPDVSIVVPVFNESANVAALISALDAALGSISWEVIFVDDNSPDGTTGLIRAIGGLDHRVRCLKRIGRRGLAGACIEGILASNAKAVAVMDGDLQHDERIIPQMYSAIANGADLVIGTRYGDGQRAPEGFSALRQRGSAWATVVCKRVLGIQASDPLSGFFMVRRERFEEIAPKLSTQGFKILLDLLASDCSGLKTVELPFVFRSRHAGQSKLDNTVVAEYLSLVLAKATGDAVSIRFVMFALVGASGVLVHLLALKAALAFAALPFALAQTAASYVAMTWNFFLNNQLTYRDRRLKGWRAAGGLLSFYAVCSVGALANVGVAQMIFGMPANWWIAGTAGALMGAVFNYAASSAVTWRRP